MARRGTARRYAQAVFQLARDRGELDQWQQDLASLSTLFGQPEVAAIVAAPRVPQGEKMALVSRGLEGVSPLALNLAHLLVTRGRWDEAGEIAAEYQLLYDAHRGVEHVEVTTAVTLKDEGLAEMAGRLEAIVCK